MNTRLAVAKHRQYQRGQTLVEYSLVIMLVGVVTIGVVMSTTSHIQAFYSNISSTVATANTPGGAPVTPPNNTLGQ